MKLIIKFLALFFFASSAHAVNYNDARITSVGIVAGEDRIRFTIDRDPNVIFLTDRFSGEQLKRLVALVMTAYTSQSKIYFIQSAESSSAAVRHYTDLITLNVGSSSVFD